MEPLDKSWWQAEKDQVHSAVHALIEHLDTNQNERSTSFGRFIKLYNNQDTSRLPLTSIFSKGNGGFDDRVTFNIVQSVIDTVVNKIAKSRPKPTFLTEDGEYEVREKAKLLTRFCEGLAHTTQIYDEGQKVFRDSCVFGTGFLHPYREGTKLKVERVFPDEIRVDDQEAMYGKPRQLHRLKFVDKDVLKTLYPAHAEAIAACKPPPNISRARNISLSDQVLVVESWHLRSGKKADDGRHTISVQSATLIDEKYKKDYFPFVPFRWNDRLLGYFGIGLAERLEGKQREINSLLDVVKKVYKRIVVPRIFMKENSKIPTAHITNEIGSIMKGVEAPVIWTPQGLPAEYYEHLRWLIASSFEEAGVSALSATGRKPEGLNAGKALREYSDIESERFVIVEQAWQNFYMEAYRQLLDLARDIGDKFEVSAPSKRFIEKIKWTDVNLEDDQFVMQFFPTSMLSSTPSGKLQDVQEMIGAGLIDKDWGLRLLDFPDLDGMYSLANAAIDDIEHQMNNIMRHGKVDPPEPFQNLELGVTMMQSAYLKAKNEGVPEEKLELFREWISRATVMRNKARADAMAAQAGGPAGAPVPAPNLSGSGTGTPPVAA